jgi:putative hydrolase of the HAD superfamily
MINTIIFDFGDVFINLEKEAQIEAFKKLGIPGPTPELLELSDLLEIGKISELKFFESVQKHIPHASLEEIRTAWNSIMGDFPLERLEFLQMLSNKYRLFLLTNTDAIHIDRFEHKVGMSFYTAFYNCFEKVYYSYEMGLRKPDPEAYNYIMRINDLSPKRTLFVDDKKANTDAAAALGLHVWNLQVGKDDVVDLFKQKHLPL